MFVVSIKLLGWFNHYHRIPPWDGIAIHVFPIVSDLQSKKSILRTRFLLAFYGFPYNSAYQCETGYLIHKFGNYNQLRGYDVLHSNSAQPPVRIETIRIQFIGKIVRVITSSSL